MKWYECLCGGIIPENSDLCIDCGRRWPVRPTPPKDEDGNIVEGEAGIMDVLDVAFPATTTKEDGDVSTN